MVAGDRPGQKWYQLQWYRDADSPRQRQFINKIDLLIVPYAFLSYWVKYIDQSNLSESPFTPLHLP